jgi:hypothetical protein
MVLWQVIAARLAIAVTFVMMGIPVAAPSSELRCA